MLFAGHTDGRLSSWCRTELQRLVDEAAADGELRIIASKPNGRDEASRP